jgi:DNA-binding NarL/FixJ family response regulator
MLGKLRILIVDDHALVRSGLAGLLERLQDFEVVGEASDGHQALQLARELHPDIVLMDVSMPGFNGLDAAERIHNEAPTSRVVILSMHCTEEFVAQALKSGALGYLLKDAAPSELETALRTVAQGQVYLSPSISRQVVESFLHGGPAGLDLLTHRQREVLQLLAEGRSTRDSAALLNLSTKTIETHRAQLMERLDIHDVAGLVRYAIKHGLIAN